MSEKEKIFNEVIKNIEAAVKEGFDEYSFIEKFEEMLKKYVEGKIT